MPNKQNRNGFSIIIALLIGAAVVAASAGVYLYQTQNAKQKPAPVVQQPKIQTPTTQTPTVEKEIKTEVKEPQNPQDGEIDTAGWQTYRNEEYGFEFKYPNNFIEDGNWNNSARIEADDFYIIIGFSDKDYGCRDTSNAETLIRKELFKANNIEFTKIIGVGRMGESVLAYSVNYYKKNEKNCINLQFIKDFGPNSWFSRNKYPEDKVINYKLYDQIISTFKFIEPQNEKSSGNFTGTYSYDFKIDDDRSGTLIDGPAGILLVEQLSPAKIYFALSVHKGAPSYNSGTVNKTELPLNGNAAIYENSEWGDCRFKILFSENEAKIEMISDPAAENYDCGFGHGVYASGVYKKENGKIPDFSIVDPKGGN